MDEQDNKQGWQDDQWRIPDELWAEIEPGLPDGKPHPLGCHRPRVDNRRVMDAILFVLRTGCQWGALDKTGLCRHSTAHRRFQEWVQAGVFRQAWVTSLHRYDQLKGIDWSWQAMDGAMTKAPLGGEKGGAQSYGPRQRRREAESADRRRRHTPGGGRRRRQPQRLQAHG